MSEEKEKTIDLEKALKDRMDCILKVCDAIRELATVAFNHMIVEDKR